jgi:hypothetical protein
VGDFNGPAPGFEQPVVRAGTVVEHQDVARDVDQISGALPD